MTVVYGPATGIHGNERASATLLHWKNNMINGTDNPMECAMLGNEVDEAIEHLQELAKSFEPNGSIELFDFEIEMGHVYTHLNRAWNSRGRTNEANDEQRIIDSEFPTDLPLYG